MNGKHFEKLLAAEWPLDFEAHAPGKSSRLSLGQFPPHVSQSYHAGWSGHHTNEPGAEQTAAIGFEM